MIEVKALVAALVALDQNEPRDLLTAEEPAIFWTVILSVGFAALLISFLITLGAIAAVAIGPTAAMPPTPATICAGIARWSMLDWVCCV